MQGHFRLQAEMDNRKVKPQSRCCCCRRKTELVQTAVFTDRNTVTYARFNDKGGRRKCKNIFETSEII